jgi:hypothetical protein
LREEILPHACRIGGAGMITASRAGFSFLLGLECRWRYLYRLMPKVEVPA